LDHAWIKPMRKQDEEERRQAQINIEHFKSFIARRRWKVHMHCESRVTRTIVTNYRDSEGVVRSKRRGEMSGKSAMYEGEYSESDTDERPESGQMDPMSAGCHAHLTSRQKLFTTAPANIELKPVKLIEYNETFDDDDDDDDSDNNDGSCQQKQDNKNKKEEINRLGMEFESKIAVNKDKSGLNATSDDANLVSHESKQFETNDVKTIEHVDETTGASVRTSIVQNVNTNEDIKISKVDQKEDIEQLDDMIVKRVTTKTRTMKTVKKTTTTTTSKKGIQSTHSACVCVCVCVFA
jgi:hypothetical protein